MTTPDYEAISLSRNRRNSSPEIVIDRVPSRGDERWGVSLVLRPPRKQATLIAKQAQEIRTLIGEGQLLYAPKDIHTTVRTLDFYEPDEFKALESAKGYIDALSQCTISSGPITVKYKGLLVHKSGVIIKGYPKSNGLNVFRNRLANLLSELSINVGPEQQIVRKTAHISLAVFIRPIQNVESLLEYVHRNQETEFIDYTYDRLDLVRFIRSDKAIVSKTIAQFEL